MELIFSQYSKAKACNKIIDSDDIIFEEEPTIAIEAKNKKAIS